MVIITFPNREIEKRGLGFLIGTFSSTVLKTGEHIVPEDALAALAGQNIPFTVQGKISYEQQMAAIRSAVSATVQRRPRRAAQVAHRGGHGSRQAVRRR